MLRKLLSRQPQPETVPKSEHDALQARYDALVEQQKHVTKERDEIGSLLLDCLTWMRSVNVTTKHKGGSALLAEREVLVERARGLEWLPGKTEEEEVTHGTTI